jgi:hypothetical protein
MRACYCTAAYAVMTLGRGLAAGPRACQRRRACSRPPAAAVPGPDQGAPGVHARRPAHRPAGHARESRAPERARARTRAQACSSSCRAAGSSRWPRIGATAWRPTRPSWPPWACRTPTPSSPRSCRSPTCPRRAHPEALPVPGARGADPVRARAQPPQPPPPAAAAPDHAPRAGEQARGRRPRCGPAGAFQRERAAVTPAAASRPACLCCLCGAAPKRRAPARARWWSGRMCTRRPSPAATATARPCAAPPCCLPWPMTTPARRHLA